MKYYEKYIEARRLNQIGCYNKALQIYRGLYNEEPENDLINYGIGSTLLSLYKDIEKHPKIERQVREHIEKAEVLGILLLGQLEEQLGNIDVARRQYKKSVEFCKCYEALYKLIILEQKLGNNEEAKKYYNQFLKEVRDDSIIRKEINYSSIFLLGKSAMELDENEVARKVFNYLLDSNTYQEGANQCLIRMDIKDRNYEDAYKRRLLLSARTRSDFIEKPLFLFLFHKLNYLHKDYPTRYNYQKNQLLEYDEEKAINHITICYKDVFLDYVDPALMFHTCNRNIKELNPIKKVGNVDCYYLDFTSNIAEVKGKSTNRISILTIADTKDILTIYPILTDSKAIEHSHIPSDNSKANPKVKRKSQIEKFNSRYNLNN